MNKIVIAGAGEIGKSVALILAEWGQSDYTIYIGDANEETLYTTLEWLRKHTTKDKYIFKKYVLPMEGTSNELLSILTNGDIILDCLPGSQAPRMAAYAKKYRLHYANLTEYVKETNQIQQLAKGYSKGFMLQTGLAPGFINVLSNKLFHDFCEQHQVEQADRVLMAVGAIPKSAQAPHYYGFTWSPVGVATEYLESTKVLRDFQLQQVPALSEKEFIYINGIKYEMDITSGGASAVPDNLERKVKTLDYKTIRYEGHYEWVKQQIQAIPNGANRISELQKRMEAIIPMVEEDVVLIFASVIGKDQYGKYRSLEQSYKILPTYVGKAQLKAIQITTAIPLAQAAEDLLGGNIKGVSFQSQVNPSDFFNGHFVSKMLKPYIPHKKNYTNTTKIYADV